MLGKITVDQLQDINIFINSTGFSNGVTVRFHADDISEILTTEQ